MLKVDFFYFKLFEKDAENYANMLRTYFFGFFFATFGFLKKKISKNMVKNWVATKFMTI